MTNRDYIVSIDENGQPYIAHVLWGGVKAAAGRASQGVGRGVRTAHKYIEKWGEGAKARYFYTQEQLQAALNEGRQKASNTLNSAKKKGSEVMKAGREKLSTTSSNAKDFSSRTSNTLKKHGSETLAVIKSTGEKVKEKAKDVAGVDERDRRDAAWEEYRKYTNGEKSFDDPGRKEALKEAQKAQDEYKKTPMGAAEHVKERAKEILGGADGTPKEIAKEAAEKAKEKASELAEKAKEKGSDTARKAAEKAKEIAKAAAEKAEAVSVSAKDKVTETVDKAKEVAKDWAGYDEKERMEAAQKEYQDKYEEGLKLTEEREPIRRAYYDFDTEMFQKYGVNYEQKMSEEERAKYDKLEADLTDISEKWWDATIRQMYSAPMGSDPSLKDKLNKAVSDYQNTPLGKLDKLRRK